MEEKSQLFYYFNLILCPDKQHVVSCCCCCSEKDGILFKDFDPAYCDNDCIIDVCRHE